MNKNKKESENYLRETLNQVLFMRVSMESLAVLLVSVYSNSKVYICFRNNLGIEICETFTYVGMRLYDKC